MIADARGSIYSYDKDLGLRASIDLSQMRFMRILLFLIRNGHEQDFQHVSKLFAKAYESIAEARWAVFEKMHG